MGFEEPQKTGVWLVLCTKGFAEMQGKRGYEVGFEDA